MLSLNQNEKKIFSKLNTPRKVQDHLEAIPINFEKDGETCISPRRVIAENRAHCIEGAIFAAAAFMFNGEKPLLMELKSVNRDDDHVLALFRRAGRWGAISKTNHAVLRYREPIYRNIRELAISFFHEYFLDDGKKTMRSYSEPLNLLRFGTKWVTANENLWYIAEALDDSCHKDIMTRSQISSLRSADPIEIKAGKLTMWQR